MITKLKKASVILTIAALLIVVLLAGCSSSKNPSDSSAGEIVSGTASTSAAVNGTGYLQGNDTSKAASDSQSVTVNDSSTAMTSGNGASSNGQTNANVGKSDSNQEQDTVVYNNSQYGFNFTLPESWKGFRIITDKWKGLSQGQTNDDVPYATGPIITIRHPLWTSANPRQDIPIMIFTINQWNEQQQDKFHIGAAPIGPSELGRNSKYVFALPARYNFAFPTGYQEVEKIINSKPLKPLNK
ncbi:MAG: hypothetical protein Q8920_06175 [Bacillota bacterium]|nr:hypothetical protein [Bacillota bacterium]